MKKVFAALMVFASCMFSSAFAQGPSKAEAVDLVKKAAAAVQAGQKDKVIAEVNSKSGNWVKGDLYLVVLGADGKHLAHPTNSGLLGQSMLDVPDEAGKQFRKERLELAQAKGEGWIDYKYKNPSTGKVEDKTMYVMKAGDVILSAGVQK
jgi:cytochrome c